MKHKEIKLLRERSAIVAKPVEHCPFFEVPLALLEVNGRDVSGVVFLAAVADTMEELARMPRMAPLCGFTSDALRRVRRWPIKGFENWLMYGRVSDISYPGNSPLFVVVAHASYGNSLSHSPARYRFLLIPARCSRKNARFWRKKASSSPSSGLASMLSGPR